MTEWACLIQMRAGREPESGPVSSVLMFDSLFSESRVLFLNLFRTWEGERGSSVYSFAKTTEYRFKDLGSNLGRGEFCL